MRIISWSAALILGLPVACADETLTGYGDPKAVYALEQIDGAAFPAEATLRLSEAGKVSGQAPCNRYWATQEAPYPWFETGPIAATKRACPQLAAEQTYLAALAAMRLAEVQGPVLILSTEGGRQMVFRAR